MRTTQNRGGAVAPDAQRRGGPAAKLPTAAEFIQTGLVAAMVEYAPAPRSDADPAEAAYRRGRIRADHGDFAGAIAEYDAANRLDRATLTRTRTAATAGGPSAISMAPSSTTMRPSR